LSPPSATSSRSATNSMYWPISALFMPIRSTGSASVMNSRSIATASVTIASSRSPASLACSSLRARARAARGRPAAVRAAGCAHPPARSVRWERVCSASASLSKRPLSASEQPPLHCPLQGRPAPERVLQRRCGANAVRHPSEPVWCGRVARAAPAGALRRSARARGTGARTSRAGRRSRNAGPRRG